MSRFWISVAMVLALVAGCESKPADDSSSNETTASTEAESSELSTAGSEQSIADDTDVTDENVTLTSAAVAEDVDMQRRLLRMATKQPKN